jgi:DMSO/TMAO reductase YedYZ heme-binding membrane subunit
VPRTTGRSRGRQGVRSGAQGAVGEHMSKVMTTVITASVVVVLVLVMTKPGRAVDAATQRFMLFYAGVFALIGLTASVGVGLVATDRIVMTPGHRVMAQAVHRAVSFGALAFLIIHIVTEILAQRSHVIDAVVPFLSPYRTFYIGLGTIASDLILLIVITSMFRKRFTAHGKAWRWRAIHYASYLAFVLGVMHGLLGGRTAKPYVDWSYGFAIALTALALVVRFLALSLRPEDSVSTQLGADRAAGGPGSPRNSPLHAAAMSMTQAQLGGTIQMLPAATGPNAAIGLPGGQPWAAIPAPGWSAISGPFPALTASPASAGEAPYSLYQGPELMPLSAPVYGRAGEQPLYEPGYDGPPRFMGAPRKHVPQDDVSSYPYGPQSHRPAGTGPMTRLGTGPMTRLGTGPMTRLGTGPMPRADSGPIPQLGSSARPRPDTGPAPRARTGPMPRADSGPMPRPGAGPPPRAGTGPMPRADSGPMPRLGSGPRPRPDAGPMPRLGAGPVPRTPSGPVSGAARTPRPDPPDWPRAHPRSSPPGNRPGRVDSADRGQRDAPGRTGGTGWG